MDLDDKERYRMIHLFVVAKRHCTELISNKSVQTTPGTDRVDSSTLENGNITMQATPKTAMESPSPI